MYVNQDLRHKDHNQHKDLQCKNQERDKYSCRKDKDQDQDFSLMTSTRYDNTNNIRTLHHLIWQKTANSLPLLTASSCDRRQPTHCNVLAADDRSWSRKNGENVLRFLHMCCMKSKIRV